MGHGASAAQAKDNAISSPRCRPLRLAVVFQWLPCERASLSVSLYFRLESPCKLNGAIVFVLVQSIRAAGDGQARWIREFLVDSEFNHRERTSRA